MGKTNPWSKGPDSMKWGKAESCARFSMTLSDSSHSWCGLLSHAFPTMMGWTFWNHKSNQKVPPVSCLRWSCRQERELKQRQHWGFHCIFITTLYGIWHSFIYPFASVKVFIRLFIQRHHTHLVRNWRQRAEQTKSLSLQILYLRGKDRNKQGNYMCVFVYRQYIYTHIHTIL